MIQLVKLKKKIISKKFHNRQNCKTSQSWISFNLEKQLFPYLYFLNYFHRFGSFRKYYIKQDTT